LRALRLVEGPSLEVQPGMNSIEGVAEHMMIVNTPAFFFSCVLANVHPTRGLKVAPTLESHSPRSN